MIKDEFKINLQLFANKSETEDQADVIDVVDEPEPQMIEPSVSKEEFEAIKKQNEELIGLLKALKGSTAPTTKLDDTIPKPDNVPKADVFDDYIAKMEKQNIIDNENKIKQEIEQTKKENEKLKLQRAIDLKVKSMPHMKEFVEGNFKNGIISDVKTLEFYTSKQFEEPQ